MPDETVNEDQIAYVYGESWCRTEIHIIDETIEVSFVDAYLTLKRKQLEAGYDLYARVTFPKEVEDEIAKLKQIEFELHEKLTKLSSEKTGEPYKAIYDKMYNIVLPQRHKLEDANTPGKLEYDRLYEEMNELAEKNEIDWNICFPLREASIGDIAIWFAERTFQACSEESAIGIALTRRRAGKLYHEVAHWEHEFDDEESEEEKLVKELGRQALEQQRNLKQITVADISPKRALDIKQI